MTEHNCKQDANVAKLKAENEAQKVSMSEFKDDVKGIRELLNGIEKYMRQLAEQRVEIKHLHEEIAEQKKCVDSLFRKVRQMELQPGQTAGKAFWVALTASASCIGGVTTGVVLLLIKGH